MPYVASVADDEPGGVFFRPLGGNNRADSPVGAYRCLYVGDDPSGCIAEAFGRFDEWDRHVISAEPATPVLPDSRFALATYDMQDDVPIRDLDDAQALLEEHLRPSMVVTRDRDVTQRWASHLFASRRYAGASWWSYYDPTWRSVALWDIEQVTLAEPPRPLSINDPDVRRAANTIARRITH